MPSCATNLKELLRLTAAPMAGISSPVFRSLCLRMGATLAFTEMISAKGLLLGNRRTEELLARHPREQPAAAQIFGADPQEMARAAAAVQAAGFDLVDINMGCPVRKVVSTGAGAALMKDIGRAAEMVSAIRERIGIPVTAKIRSGWTSGETRAAETARALEAAGLSAIIIHPRTRDQGYAGAADWSQIREAKQALSIPVIGNGDVVDGPSAVRLRESTGCDGIMIGRAALGNPWIFREVGAALQGAPLPARPGGRERLAVFLAHYRGLQRECGQAAAHRRMKRMASWYLKGCRGASAARAAVHGCASGRDLVRIVRQVLRPQPSR